MTPEAWRANVAGFLDAADALVENVERSLSVASAMKPAKVSLPGAYFDQLAETRDTLKRLSQWMVDPNNNLLERRNG